ncbi:hypothetical protein KIPB_012601, partial [Kipferlia bialata]|eukprot:g12601.t1
MCEGVCLAEGDRRAAADNALPSIVRAVLGGCHSLVQVSKSGAAEVVAPTPPKTNKRERGKKSAPAPTPPASEMTIAGDPLEIAAFKAAGFSFKTANHGTLGTCVSRAGDIPVRVHILR